MGRRLGELGQRLRVELPGQGRERGELVGDALVGDHPAVRDVGEQASQAPRTQGLASLAT
jgi:hypothetical protein